MLTRRSLLAAPFAPRDPGGILFRARGGNGFLGSGDRTAFIRADGSGLRVFDFAPPNQQGWGVYGVFRDGRVILLSIERNKDWDTQPFHVYYPNSRTHIWIANLATGALTEIAARDRIAPFQQVAALLPGEERMLVTASIQGKEVLYVMDLDGRNARALTSPGEYVYGIAVSPDGKRVAFHGDYRIHTMDIDGGGRKEVAGERGWIYFGPRWSPDGEWLCWQVCDGRVDRGHDWSDLWIGRPDGRDVRRLTTGMRGWFAASYGTAKNPGGGSNMPSWSPRGNAILAVLRSPDAKVPWEYQTARPDTTHFNRDFRPDLARGGTQLTLVDPRNGEARPLTLVEDGRWDFRGEWRADGRIAFCRARTGANPALWVMNGDGSGARELTSGAGHGVDHPRWVG